MKLPKEKKRGVAMVEILITSAIILLTVLTLLGTHALYLRSALSNTNSLKATYLAQEGLEAARFLRDVSWENQIEGRALGTNYYAELVSSAWALSSTASNIENFSRTLVFNQVERDANGDIVASLGTVDPNTKLVTSTVSWTQNGSQKSVSLSTYLTNLYGN
jgi:Tfp pilus assembly protein PilV